MSKVLCRGGYRVPRTAKSPFKDGDTVVQSGLALTPSDIERLSRQGIAVSTPSADTFSYDSDSSSWQIAPEYLRSSDRNSMWELSKASKKRIMQARKSDYDRYH